MGSRAIIGGALCLSLSATVGFVACRGPQPGPFPQSTAAPTAEPAASASPLPTPSPGPSASAPADTVAAAVSAARACTAPSSELANRPDGGLVFVNAWRREDAGNIDRLQGVVDAIASNDAAFRCCFDVWRKAHPAGEGKLMLEMELAPDGAVTSAAVDPERSNVDDAVTTRCVIEVAQSVAYPPSPSNRSTLIEYPFVLSNP